MLRPATVQRVLLVSVSMILITGCRKTETPTNVDVVASVTVSPPVATLTSVGATVQLAASAQRQDGTAIAGTSFTWGSSDAGVAVVSDAGLVTAVGNGVTTVAAAASGQSGSASVTVAIPVVAGVVSVTPETATLTAVSQTVQLSVLVLDTDTNLIANPAGTWTSSDPWVATVTASGLVTAVADGSSAVVYAVDGVADTAQITVATGPPPPASFTVEYDAGWPQEAVWGSSPSDFWSVGYDGTIMHNTGSGWTNVTPGITDARLSAIWGASSNDVWAAGQNGEILNYDGSNWSTVTSPTTEWLLDIEGLSATEVWAVGQGGTVLRWDGTSWTLETTPTREALYAVRPVAADDVWAVGANGIVLHWDGAMWSRVPQGLSFQILKDILVMAPDDIWVAAGGVLIHYDGTSWSLGQAGVAVFTEMFMAGPDEAWGVSNGAQFNAGEIWRFNGTTWTEVTPASNIISRFNGIYGTSASDIWAVGQTTGGGAGITAWHYDGSTWTERNGGLVPMSISGTWGSGPNDVWAVTDRLGIVHWDGAQWTDETVGRASGQGFFNVWGAAADDVWAVGGSSSHIYHFDGSSWANVTPAGAITGGLGVHDIWGSASNDVWAVQPGGRIIRWDGSAWRRISSGLTNVSLRAVWGSAADDIYVGGGSSSSVLLHWNGSQWSDVSPSLGSSIWELWGTGPDDIYAVGNFWLARFDGANWSPVSTPLSAVTSVRGSAANDVWITGRVGAFPSYDAGIAHWDGSQWTDLSMTLLPSRGFNTVWVEPGVSNGACGCSGAQG